MLKFSTNKLEIENELLNEIKLFFYDLDADIEISHIGNFVDNNCENIVKNCCDDIEMGAKMWKITEIQQW